METVLSGIRSTGRLHLGNYFGALRNFVKMQHTDRCFFFIADYHSLTTHPDPKALHGNVKNVLAEYLAAGLDPEVATIYIQSDVPQVAELSLLLSMHAYIGELERTASFKDKIRKQPENVNAGLLCYPVLMAADILAYQADLVPVGIDQKQHLELARDIAIRFNNLHGNVFTVPEPYIPEAGAKIMSLQEPTKKMSKSDENVNAFITILDDEDTIIRKFKRAITDSEAEVVYREGKDGINNLMNIYSVITGKSYDDIAKEFEGKGYGDFKLAVGETVADALKPVRERFAALQADKSYLESCYRHGAEQALAISARTLDKVYKKIGFLQ